MTGNVRPVAWITGAGSGFGRAVALRLVADGYAIAATARSQADLDVLAAEGAIHPFAGDVTDRSAMADIAERIEATLGPVEAHLTTVVFDANDAPTHVPASVRHKGINTRMV